MNIPITTNPDGPTQTQLERDIDLITMSGQAYRVPISVGPCFPYMVKVQHIGHWRQFDDPLQAVKYIRGMAC